MHSLWLVCTGGLKERFYREAAAEYAKRLRPFCKLTLVELAEQRLPRSPSPAEIEAALEREARAVRQALPASCGVAALCVEGREMDSTEFSRFLTEFPSTGLRHLAFVIGSSYGLHSSVKHSARLCLSMSPMTFPHHLARVMLLEQIYRSFQIAANSPYHK